MYPSSLLDRARVLRVFLNLMVASHEAHYASIREDIPSAKVRAHRTIRRFRLGFRISVGV